MSEVLIPPWIIPEEETQEWLDEGSSVFTAAFSPGLAQRQSYGGLRLKLSRKHTVRGEEKALLLSILKSAKGQYNTLRTKVHFALRGSFPAAELLINGTFSNGATGWGINVAGESTLSVADRVLRVTRSAITAGYIVRTSANVTVTQYASYVARVFTKQGRGPFATGDAALYFGASGFEALIGYTTSSHGQTTAAFTPLLTSGRLGFADIQSGKIAGDYFESSCASLSPCALVDNGQNMFLRSDEIDNAGAWSSLNLSGVTANNATAPDGSNNGEDIVEDGSNADHARYQQIAASVAVADYCFGVALKAGSRSFAYLDLYEATSGTLARQFFNLTTGAVGASGSTGANWANRRAFTVPLGNGWYACYIVARKTNLATTLRGYIGIATADGTATYAGNGSSFIRAWRATIAQSSVPTRLVQTTATATASTGTSQTGNALYIKGLLASTSGLLLPEDIFEINGELKQCTAALNSDAAGLGYLQFEPALVRSPADNDPVIILDPMGKFLVSNLKIDNEFGTQAVVTYDLEHIYE